MAFGDGLLNRILLAAFKETDLIAPLLGASIALWIGNPGSDGLGGAEVDEGTTSYESVLLGEGDWTAPSGGVISNSSAITFPEAEEAWGEVTHVLIILPFAGGAPFEGFYGALAASKDILTGSIPRFAIGDLVITLV